MRSEFKKKTITLVENYVDKKKKKNPIKYSIHALHSFKSTFASRSRPTVFYGVTTVYSSLKLCHNRRRNTVFDKIVSVERRNTGKISRSTRTKKSRNQNNFHGHNLHLTMIDGDRHRGVRFPRSNGRRNSTFFFFCKLLLFFLCFFFFHRDRGVRGCLKM